MSEPPSTPEKFCEKRKVPVLTAPVDSILAQCEKVVEKWWFYSGDGHNFYPTRALAEANCSRGSGWWGWVTAYKFTRREIEEALEEPGHVHIHF